MNENGESVNNTFTVIYPYTHYTDLWPRVVVLLFFFAACTFILKSCGWLWRQTCSVKHGEALRPVTAAARPKQPVHRAAVSRFSSHPCRACGQHTTPHTYAKLRFEAVLPKQADLLRNLPPPPFTQDAFFCVGRNKKNKQNPGKPF